MSEVRENQSLGEIEILHAEDGMSATLCLSPSDRNKTYELGNLKALIKESGVAFGVLEDKLQEMISEKIYNKEVVVARGEPAKNGKDGWYEFLFPINVDTKPKILKDGSVDYTSCGEIPSVDEGQEIVHYHPATASSDGMDIYGGILVGKNGRDLARLRGKGFILSEDNCTYTARVTGKATYINEILNVEEQLTIEGDVSYTTTGNVHFVGDIWIKGNVLTGMSVKSDKGSITVDGYVEAAVLVAKKDVVLKNGMQGNGQGKVATCGSVSGKFFEQTFIDCDGDVSANAIMNCQINSGQDIKVSGKFGVIIGGTISAIRCVESMRIGNMAEVRTDIRVGVAEDLFSLMTQHERVQKSLQGEVDQLTEGLKKIDILLEAGAGSKEDLQDKKLKLTRAKIEKDSRINEIIKKKQETAELMTKANDARVTIIKRVYPGTTITVSGKKVVIKEEIDSVEYARRGSGIVSYGLT